MADRLFFYHPFAVIGINVILRLARLSRSRYRLYCLKPVELFCFAVIVAVFVGVGCAVRLYVS